MSRTLPNIDVATVLKQRDRLGFKQFVLQVNTDTFIYSYFPNEIEVNDEIYFTLYLRNKRFIFDILEIDNVKDYVDVYLYGVKQPQDRYDAIVIGAGHNGLVAANYLAAAKKNVLVLEQRHVVGGAALTEELIPGFKFSRCSYVLSLFRKNIIK